MQNLINPLKIEKKKQTNKHIYILVRQLVNKNMKMKQTKIMLNNNENVQLITIRYNLMEIRNI